MYINIEKHMLHSYRVSQLNVSFTFGYIYQSNL